MANPLFATAILGKGVTWTNADSAATKKDITAVASGNGMLVSSISAILDDTTARVVQLFANDGSTDFLIGSSAVAALAGSDGATPGSSLLANVSLSPFASSNGDCCIPSGWKLRAQQVTQLTSGKTLTLFVQAGSL
jgi:hypothetical protein